MVPILSSRLPLRSVFARFLPGFLCALLLAALPAAARAEAPYVPIQPGHSAMWFDPARAGEGWIVGILSEESAALYWFTFDDAGEPRWLEGVGRIVRDPGGDSIVFSELIAPRGGRFGPDFDPAQVVREVKGSAVISFSDCQHGRVTFSAFGKTGDFPLTRLTRTMAAGCGPIHGTPGEPVRAEAGQSGGWYDPAYNGQGYVLTWLANGSAALGWFTYDPEGNPYWMVGTGEVEEDRLVFPALYSARGGRFGEAFDPAQVEHTPWGRVELALGCDSGAAEYEATASGFGSGRFDLEVLARLAKPACPWVKPTLTDLYDLEWTELPIPAYTTPLSPVHFEMNSIADDGTVLGGGRWDGWAGVVRLRPGGTEWEKLLEGGGQPFVTPDGATVYAYQVIPSPPEETGRSTYDQLVMWREATGWQPLPGTVYATNVTYGMSQNGKWLTGAGRFVNHEGYAPPWKWSEETGQILLEDYFATPLGISDDGDTVVGAILVFSSRAAIWIDNAMQFIFDNDGVQLGIARTCNADCSLIVGSGRYMGNPVPHSPLSWYRDHSGAVTYLDLSMPEGATASSAAVMSSDGSLIVGDQVVWEESLSKHLTDGWLWTQDTGAVSLRDILEGEGEFQLTDRWNRSIVDVSSDGTRILFSGYTTPPRGSLQQYRAGVLRLIPKTSGGAFHQPQGVMRHEISE